MRHIIVLFGLHFFTFSYLFALQPIKTDYVKVNSVPTGYFSIPASSLHDLATIESRFWNNKQDGPFFLGFAKQPNAKNGQYPIILFQYAPLVSRKDNLTFEDAAVILASNIDERSYEFAETIGLDSISVLNVEPLQRRLSYIDPVLNSKKEWIVRFNAMFVQKRGCVFVYGLYPIQDARDFYRDFRIIVHNIENNNSHSSLFKTIKNWFKSYFNFFFTMEGRLKLYGIIFLIAVPFVIIPLLYQVFRRILKRKK